MSREHLSITSLTCTSTSKPPRYKTPSTPSLYPMSNDGCKEPLLMKSVDSLPSPSSATSSVSPTQYEIQMSTSPNSSMYTAEWVRKDMNGNTSATDSNSSSGSTSRHQNGYSLYHEPMSLDERRKRNKAASAKYRAKKQTQISQMSNEIAMLTEENIALQKRLQQVCDDNELLRANLLAMQDYSDQTLKDNGMKRNRENEHMAI
ncbi:hypothetical protein BGW37DRAFT_482270, partial [Umbelopsis sp. PMI_123]